MYSPERFEGKIFSAKNEISIAGVICKFTAWALPILFIFMGIYYSAEGESDLSNYFYSGALIAAVIGAPLGALGSIANQQKKQTALLAIQSWEMSHLNIGLRGLDKTNDDEPFLPWISPNNE